VRQKASAWARRFTSGEEPAQRLVVVETGVGEQAQCARQAFEDRAVTNEDRRHPQHAIAPYAEEFPFS
jgi:hypothetical protein